MTTVWSLVIGNSGGFFWKLLDWIVCLIGTFLFFALECRDTSQSRWVFLTVLSTRPGISAILPGRKWPAGKNGIKLRWAKLVWSVNNYLDEHTLTVTIGGHSVRYPWSAISDWAWYRNVRYRSEERRVRHYVGYRNKLLSDFWHPTSKCANPRSAVVRRQILDMKSVGLKPVWKIVFIWDWFVNFRYRNIRYWFSPISEWKLMSISELFRCRNERIYSDIFCSDIGIRDVDVGYRRHKGWCRCPPMTVTEVFCSICQLFLELLIPF
jgi:hypothetical protein